MDEFSCFVDSVFHMSTGDLLASRAACTHFLESLPEDHRKPVILSHFLRSLPRAVYSTEPSLHYGLGKYRYSHFTSPIRRYPDLVLHRQLASWIAGKGGRLDLGWLNAAALHCSEREQNADDAERALDEIKKYRYLQMVLERGGAENAFDAVVSKCTRYGVFVDLPALAVGGMVHVSRLSNAYLRWDDVREELVGGGKTWGVGARLKVRVEKVDFDRRLVDFVPVPVRRAPSARGAGEGKRQHEGKTGGNSDDEKGHSSGRAGGRRRGARRS